MNDREAALIDAFLALLAESRWYEERFVQAVDENGLGWSFGQENLRALAIHHTIEWSQGKRDAEPTPAMVKLVGQFLTGILEGGDPRPLITAVKNPSRARHRGKNPPKQDNADMVRGVLFFVRHGCEQADAVRLTASALGLEKFEGIRARIQKAYKANMHKGLDAIDIMLEQATRHWR